MKIVNPIARFSDFVDERRHPRNYQIFLFVIFASIGICALLASATPEQVRVAGIQMPPLCPFKLLTGVDCPGCGITRALILALHGSWTESFQRHFWGIPLALLVLFQIPYRLYLILGGHALRPAPALLKAWSYRIVILSLLVPWVFRTALLFTKE